MYSAKINNKKIKLNHQQWLRLIGLEWTRIIIISSHAATTYWLEPKRSGTGEKKFSLTKCCTPQENQYHFGDYCENYYQAHRHLRIRVPKTPCFLLRHLDCYSRITVTYQEYLWVLWPCIRKRIKSTLPLPCQAALRWMCFNGFFPCHVCHSFFVGWFSCADSRRCHLSSKASSLF